MHEVNLEQAAERARQARRHEREQAEAESEFTRSAVAFIPARPGEVALVALWWLPDDSDELHVEVREEPIIGWGIDRGSSARAYADHWAAVAFPVFAYRLSENESWAMPLPSARVRVGDDEYENRDEWVADIRRLYGPAMRHRREQARAAIEEPKVAQQTSG